MLKLLFLTIILYIIVQHILDDCNEIPTNDTSGQVIAEQKQIVQPNSIKPDNYTMEKPYSENGDLGARDDHVGTNSGMVKINAPPSILKTAKPRVKFQTQEKPREHFAQDSLDPNTNSQPKVWEFDKPNPWTKVIYLEQDEYPYYFHIKINIPSLNDYQVWKQIVPNLDFNPRSGELIIPSKEEASALALANLICINFSGQMSIDNILEKNLIQISVSKARSYEVVQNKLREQIIENLYGKSVTNVQTSFEQDLARNIGGSNNSRVDFSSEQFTDTFEHFSEQSQSGGNVIEAYDGSDFSYL